MSQLSKKRWQFELFFASFCDNVSAAKEVSESMIENIETPYYPDEDLIQQWIDSLLSCQFTMEEIKSGLAKETVDRLQV